MMAKTEEMGQMCKKTPVFGEGEFHSRSHARKR